MLVYRTIIRYNDTNSITDRPRSGRPRTARSTRVRKAVRSRVKRNPRRSMRKMAKDLGVNRESLRNLVHNDLGLKSLKRRTVHHLTPALRRKQLERCKGLLRRLAPRDIEKIMFSDGKLFTVKEAKTLKTIEYWLQHLMLSLSSLNTSIGFRNHSQSWFGEE